MSANPKHSFIITSIESALFAAAFAEEGNSKKRETILAKIHHANLSEDCFALIIKRHADDSYHIEKLGTRSEVAKSLGKQLSHEIAHRNYMLVECEFAAK